MKKNTDKSHLRTFDHDCDMDHRNQNTQNHIHRGIKKNRDWLLVLVFCVLIGLPYPVWIAAGSYLTTVSQENRMLAEMPQITEFSLEQISDFPRQVEDWLEDHLPFRQQLVTLHGSLNYYALKASADRRVIIGKEGWLYYNDTKNGNPVGSYTGRNLLEEHELIRIAENMQLTRDNLAAEGIEFFVFIPPDKERVCFRRLPEYYGLPSEEYPVQQIADYLEKHTDVKVIYPLKELQQAAKLLGDDTMLYRRTDTHWTKAGAYVGARALLEECGISLPSPDSQEVWIEEQISGAGDLAGILGIKKTIGYENAYTIKGYPENDAVCLEEKEESVIRYQSRSPDRRRLMIVRDSFCSSMAPVLGAQFAESIMWHNTAFNYDMIETYQPDIFVLEMVERFAPKNMYKFCYRGKGNS